MTSPTYSVKYALIGTEHYVLNGRRMAVGAGRYLIVNKEQPFGTYFHSQRRVTGLCLHLEKSYLYDVYLQLTQTPEWLLDHPSEPFQELQFQELVSSDKENGLGAFLREVVPRLNATEKHLAMEEDEFFFQLASRLLLSQKVDASKTSRLQVQKSSTQKELLQRLAIAKELIEQEQDTALNIAALAQQSSLSPSHLFRCFKQVYGLSPHQYQLKHRLQKAAQLLLTKRMTASEVASHCGFADLASFSKAFKKWNGVSPQEFKKSALCYW
jgi:AraC-like DNA-binding protein